jgi:hypothetical protein
VKLVAEAPPALNAIAAAAVPARRSEVSLQFISTLSPCSTVSGHHRAICMPNEKLTLNQSFTCPRAAWSGQGCKKFRRSARTETAAGVILFGWKTPLDQLIGARDQSTTSRSSQIGVGNFSDS